MPLLLLFLLSFVELAYFSEFTGNTSIPESFWKVPHNQQQRYQCLNVGAKTLT